MFPLLYQVRISTQQSPLVYVLLVESTSPIDLRLFIFLFKSLLVFSAHVLHMEQQTVNWVTDPSDQTDYKVLCCCDCLRHFKTSIYTFFGLTHRSDICPISFGRCQWRSRYYYIRSIYSHSALGIEFLYTFALVSVMLNCATTKSQVCFSWDLILFRVPIPSSVLLLDLLYWLVLFLLDR